MIKTHCKRGHPLSGDNLYVSKGQRWCRACRNMLCIEYRKRNPRAVKNRILKREYKIPVEVYEEKLKEQEGRCKICRELLSEPQVDHDHETEQVRDLLCRTCNLAVGYVRENLLIAENLVAYLKRWK